MEILALTFLKKFTIARNNLLDLWPVPKQLEFLNVSHNNLTKIGENISNLVNLKVLDLSYNKLTNTSGIGSLCKLQTLNLSNNLLTGLDDITKLHELQELDIQFNTIETVNSL